jgi:hypothetical protein
MFNFEGNGTESILGPGCVKTRESCEDAQNGFLSCRLSTEVASNICFQSDTIEIELLHENWTTEFSHSLGQSRHVGRRLAPSGPPRATDILGVRGLVSKVP